MTVYDKPQPNEQAVESAGPDADDRTFTPMKSN